MITAIIVDDERKNISTLTNLLKSYCPQMSIVGTANSAASGKELIEKVKPQLVFLDIEMPYGSGFDMLRAMPRIDAEIIFITAFDQYAITAFRYAALDYLLKPVDIEQLELAVQRAEKRIAEKALVLNYNLLLRNMDEKDAANKAIALTDNGQQFFISVSDIMYIIANGSYTHIHTAKRTFVSTKNLIDYEGLLPATIFYRIHHGHIINTLHVDRIQKGRGGTVCMKDKKELEIAVRRKEGFLKMLNK
ncbi:MAG: two component transcriptional regulator, LytTR family [Flavipsychrobacter sp.]|jgi:two-component system LytT family response regulator|nr:two component transcriptional regulator, LytTR family [Flavipsychrobacter sp.]